jgi:hypothetical protein
MDFNSQIAQMNALNDALYAQLGDTQGALKAQVDAWHANALYWEQLADKVANGTPDDQQNWANIGISIGQNAQEIAQELNDSTLAAQAGSFIAGFPAALGTVITTAVHGVATTAGTVIQDVAGQAGNAASAITWAAAKPLLIAGGVVALIAFVLVKSGIGVRSGPVRLG